MQNGLEGKAPIEYTPKGLMQLCQNIHYYIEDEGALDALDSFIKGAGEDAFDENLMQYLPQAQKAFKFLKTISRDTLISILSNLSEYKETDPNIIEVIDDFLHLAISNSMRHDLVMLALQIKFSWSSEFVRDEATDFLHTSINMSYSIISDLRNQMLSRPISEPLIDRFWHAMGIAQSLIFIAGEYGDGDVANLLIEAIDWGVNVQQLSFGSIIGLSEFKYAIKKIRRRE